MSRDDTAQVAARHLLSSEIRPRMAKADLRKAEKSDAWRLLGPAIERTRVLAALSLKEFADAIERDERQVKRWIDGEERPQFEVVFAVHRFRGLLVIALAELAGNVDVHTTITIRRVG